MQLLKPGKIKFEGWGKNEVHIVSVDGTNFHTEEFRLELSSKWYDHKTYSCGLKYEFALAIRRNKLVWMRGPFPAGKLHDLTVFRGGSKKQGKKNWDRDSLYFKLPQGMKAIGDSGYNGFPSKVTTSHGSHSKEFCQFIARAKDRQESFNSRLKAFNI